MAVAVALACRPAIRLALPCARPTQRGPLRGGRSMGGGRRGIYRPRPRGPLSPPLSARAQTRGSPSPGVRRPLGDREPETMAHDARKLSLLPRERGVRERPDVRGAQPGRPASGFTGINEKCFPSIQVHVGTEWAKAEPGTTRGGPGFRRARHAGRARAGGSHLARTGAPCDLCDLAVWPIPTPEAAGRLAVTHASAGVPSASGMSP